MTRHSRESEGTLNFASSCRRIRGEAAVAVFVNLGSSSLGTPEHQRLLKQGIHTLYHRCRPLAELIVVVVRLGSGSVSGSSSNSANRSLCPVVAIVVLAAEEAVAAVGVGVAAAAAAAAQVV